MANRNSIKAKLANMRRGKSGSALVLCDECPHRSSDGETWDRPAGQSKRTLFLIFPLLSTQANEHSCDEGQVRVSLGQLGNRGQVLRNYSCYFTREVSAEYYCVFCVSPETESICRVHSAPHPGLCSGTEFNFLDSKLIRVVGEENVFLFIMKVKGNKVTFTFVNLGLKHKLKMSSQRSSSLTRTKFSGVRRDLY
jgi:hypothetical protein